MTSTSGRGEREVLVIIGAGGMGRAIAHRVGAGRTIVLGDVQAEQADRVAAELAEHGHAALAVQVDVSSRESIAELAGIAAGAGRVVNLVHTAGLSPEQASMEAVLAVDLLGVALVIEEFLNVIEPGGAAVVIASMAGHLIPPLAPEVEQQLATIPADELLGLPVCAADQVLNSHYAYVLAKRANHLRVAGAASAWGRRGVRINSISPGVISTAMGRQELAGASGDGMRAMIAGAGMGRIGTPDDIAVATEFLLGPGAGFITGVDLAVDGGVTGAVRTGTLDTSAAS